MSGHSATYTGDNVDEIRDLGAYVLEHPTQDAIIVFTHEGALDPAGTVQPGQTVIVDDDGVRVVGMPEAPALSVPEDLRFDPTKANVGEVQTYLRSLGDDQDEIDRVLTAERNGKNRKSIVGAAPTDPEDPPTPRTVPTPVDAALTAPHTTDVELPPPGPASTDDDTAGPDQPIVE